MPVENSCSAREVQILTSRKTIFGLQLLVHLVAPKIGTTAVLTIFEIPSQVNENRLNFDFNHFFSI